MKNILYLLIVGLGLAADQLTKLLVVSKLPLGAAYALLPFLQLHHVRNTGAAWSLFAGNTFGLAVFSVVLLGVLLVWLAKTPAELAWQRVALCLVIAGALGNMLDRFRLGYVVDFLELPHWPVFNVADILLCCGVGLLALCLLLEERRQAANNENNGK